MKNTIHQLLAWTKAFLESLMSGFLVIQPKINP